MQTSRTDACRLGPRRCVGECTPYLTDWWLPLRGLEKEMPICSSDDTQVAAQVRPGKLVRYRAKVTVRPDPCLVVLCSVCCSQSVVSSQWVELFGRSGER